MKRTQTFIKNNIITLLFLFSILTSFTLFKGTASAAVESWMYSAQRIPLNSSVSGIASNNVAPTLMDPWWSYEEHFYFYVPAKSQVTLNVSVGGTRPFNGVYLMDSNGKRLKEIWNGSWTYSRSTNRSSISFTTVLPAGDYYIKQWDIYSDTQYVSYTTKVSTKTISQPAIQKVTVKKPNFSRISKASKNCAKLTWKKASGVSGYQIYRSTSKNGSYKKIKTVSSNTTSFKNKGLTRKRTYYYKIRSYKKVNGKTYYSSFSTVKKIKM